MHKTLLGLVVLLLGLVSSSFAIPISSGSFDIAGTIFVTNAVGIPVVTPGGTCAANTACIFWSDSDDTHNGLVDVSAAGLPNGNIPASIAGNDAATMASLANPPDVVGSPISLPLFLTLLNGGITTDFTLTNIVPGIYNSLQCGSSPAVGQTCTPPGSLFNLVNNPPPPGQATITWAMTGTLTTGGTWTGNFTSSFPGIPYQTVLADLNNNNFVDETFQATFFLTPPATVPEPAEMTLIGIGLMLLGWVGLRHRARKSY